MDIKDLKLVKGALEKGKPATMTFFDDVEWWSCDRFVEELEYIENYVQPSEIRILINSAGGNVVEGMKVVKAIQAVATRADDRPVQDVVLLRAVVEE